MLHPLNISLKVVIWLKLLTHRRVGCDTLASKLLSLLVLVIPVLSTMTFCITLVQLIIAFREGFIERQSVSFDERWEYVIKRNNELQTIWIWFNSSAGIMV